MTGPTMRRGLTRHRPLVRTTLAYALFVLSEYSVWIAMLLYAYDRGGTTTAALVATAQLLPAAFVAPLAARVADRRSPLALLAGGYLLQAAAMAVTAGGVVADAPAAAYAGAVLASAMVTTTRPAQAALVPSLAVTPEQLTAGNVALGWAEAVCIMLSGLLVGLLVPLGGPAVVIAVGAGLGLLALLLVVGLRARTAPGAPALESVTADATLRLRPMIRDPRLRVLLGLLTAEAVVVGALDLLFVVLAVDVLHRSQAWTGYLNLAYGAGAVVAAAGATALIGRRLGAPVLASVLMLGGSLGALAFRPGSVATVALVAVGGAARALLDVAVRTLLQRTASTDALGRVFGIAEGLTMAGFAAGALLVPPLVGIGGDRLALVTVAAVLPFGAAAGGAGLLRLDAAARVPVVEIALLRSLPLFAELPPPQLEALARSLTRVDLPADTVLMREGEPGETFYAIASGELEARQAGGLLRRNGRGEGVGEIALLRETPRTATVTAVTDATVYRLPREPFLIAVTGHEPTRGRAGSIAAHRLATTPSMPHSARST